MKRRAFFISDRTGITAEMFSQALLSQFEEEAEFVQKTVPFVDTPEKALETVQMIEAAFEQDQVRPLVFVTVVMPEIRNILNDAPGLVLDFFKTFIGPLETELALRSSFRVGKTHSTSDLQAYDTRMSAVNFALNNDDGVTTTHYKDADIILVGVSRCGKTPTSLYLAMQFGLKAANYPFTEDDMGELKLPKDIEAEIDKVYGLTIDPMRLHDIRSERRPNSKYSSLQQCRHEVREVESLYRRKGIHYINTTTRSIEEIASKILVDTELERRIY